MDVKILILVISSGAWLLMMQRLLKEEVIGYWDYQEPPSYRVILKDRTKAEIKTTAIYRAEQRVGTLISRIIPESAGGTRLSSDLTMSVAFPTGKPMTFTLKSRTSIDADFRIRNFSVTFRVAGLTAECVGARKGSAIEIDVKSPLGPWKSVVPYELEETISDSFFPIISAPNLVVGKKWRIRTVDFDPLAGGIAYATRWASVEMKDYYVWNGAQMNVYYVEIRKNISDENPIDTLMVSEDGLVLNQELPMFGAIYRMTLEERKLVAPESVLE